MTSRKLLVGLAALLIVVSSVSLAHAQDDDAPVLQYRQKLMQGIRASMGSIGDIMKFKLPYGNAHVATHAKNISEYSTMISAAFEKKAAMGLTDAKPAVWESFSDFTAKADALQKASSTLASAADGGDMQAVMAGLKGVGDACRGCHDSYRKPEEERFERK